MSEGPSKVLIVTQTFPPEMGGNASRMGDSVKYLAAEGWEATVVAPQHCYPPGNFERTWERHSVERRNGAVVHRLWTWQPGSSDPSFVSRTAYYLLFAIHALLWTLVRGRRYDLYFCTTPPVFASLPALVASALFRKPLVVDVRDLWINAAIGLGFVQRRSLTTRLSRRYEELVMHRADRILTTTDEMSDRIRDDYPDLPADRLTVIPNGVDTEVFAPREGIEEERTVVYIGNVGHMMDFEAAVRSMQFVDEPLELRIVGDGDLRPETERLVDELDLGDRITVHDPIDREEVPTILSRAMIGIVPLKPISSLRYAVPIKTYEYMACKLPVVGTGEGAIESVVSDQETGVLVDDDPRAIADAFESLAGDPGRRVRLGENGYRCATEQYDRRVISRRLGEVLRSVVADSSGSKPGAERHSDR